jgi:hypothetical protein
MKPRKLFVLVLLAATPAFAQFPWSAVETTSRTLFVGTADKAIEAASGSLMPTGVGTNAIRKNSAVAGKAYRVVANGAYQWGTNATLALTLTLGGTTVASSGTILPVYLSTNQAWRVEADIVCRTAGASATWVANGVATLGYESTNAMRVPFSTAVARGASVPVTKASTADLTVDLYATLVGTGSAYGQVPTNRIVTHNLTISASR